MSLPGRSRPVEAPEPVVEPVEVPDTPLAPEPAEPVPEREPEKVPA